MNAVATMLPKTIKQWVTTESTDKNGKTSIRLNAGVGIGVTFWSLLGFFAMFICLGRNDGFALGPMAAAYLFAPFYLVMALSDTMKKHKVKITGITLENLSTYLDSPALSEEFIRSASSMLSSLTHLDAL
tara:strand:+ start:119 stop:508 length:390 start_codon:yes stop_codon:yes gene_type:complete